jgi:hypothetical protein
MRADLAGIALPGERVQLIADSVAEQTFERVPRRIGELADRENALVPEFRFGDGSDAPHQ